jgi:hypothetical protein
VGMFRLPGIVLTKEEVTEDKLSEMDAWRLTEQGTGTRMTDLLWSFKTEAQRDWFILRWIDHIPKEDITESQA